MMRPLSTRRRRSCGARTVQRGAGFARIGVEGREHFHQPVQHEPPEIGVADAREVRRREPGQGASPAHREPGRQ